MFPPGPSEWDIRIVARVTPEQIDQWVITEKQDFKMTSPDWVAKTADLLDTESVTE